MSKKAKETPIEQKIPDGIPAGHAITLAEEKLVHITEAYTEDRDLVNQILGQAQMAGASEDFFRTVRISKLAFIKENKLYRILSGAKTPHRAEKLNGTWEEFCQLLNKSVDQVDRDITNLREFGEEALDSMSRMGIGYRELRQYRRLPEDQKTALIEVARLGDKESFVELAEEIITRNAKENEALVKRADDVEADLEASRQRVAVKEKETEKLTGEVLKLKRRVETQTPDEAAADIRKEAALFAFRAEHAISGELRPAFQALFDHAEANGGNHSEFMLGLIAQIEREANALRAEFGLLKAKPDGEVLPDWMRDDVMEKIKADAEEQKPEWLRAQEATNA